MDLTKRGGIIILALMVLMLTHMVLCSSGKLRASIPNIKVLVDTTKVGLLLNPDIFGVNYADEEHFATNSMKYTVNRKGGNADTRYNWEFNIRNGAQDWFYMNTLDKNTPGKTLPEGSSATRFVDTSIKYGSKSMLQASMIGFTPIGETDPNLVKKWAFSVSKYGKQSETECTRTGNAFWCKPDAGNGIKADGTAITGVNPLDTSQPVDENFVKRWMKFMKSRGTPVYMWSLDNEIDLWHRTHNDLHPKPVTYDELWNKTRTYASAIKSEDSNVLVFGPASWGFCGYFYSSADPNSCTVGPDRRAHDNLPLIDFYLKKVCEYKKTNGVKLVDYLDIHYYPQASGVYNPYQTSDDNAELRLRSVKSLYDFNYVDESWVKDAESNGPLSRIAVIPRMRQSIQQYCPEMKLSISEYNFGADTLISSALAQVEVLSIFAREGVDLATRFSVPKVGSLVEKAFQLYMNFDGSGSKVSGKSVSALSSNIDSVGSYAFHDKNVSKLFIFMINKLTSNTSVDLSINSASGKTINQFILSTNGLNRGTIFATDSSGLVTITLEARSANLFVVNSIA